MNKKKMTYSWAIQIIRYIDTLDPVKDAIMIGEAIAKILSMTTINAVKKDDLLNVVRFLFNEFYEWEDPAPTSTTKETKIGRLIDAEPIEKAIREMMDSTSVGEYNTGYDDALTAIQDLLSDAPTIPTPPQWISADTPPEEENEVKRDEKS